MNRLKIGWARREYSLNVPALIPGQSYIRISTGILDPLMITALCLDGGPGMDAVIFCSVDLSSLYCEIIDDVLDEVGRRRPQIPRDAIILNSTHTHTAVAMYETPEKAPDGTPIYSGVKYRAYFTQQCADAICEAWDSREEGGMAYGYGYAVVAHSRRSVYLKDQSFRDATGSTPNGHAVMYGGTFREDFSHYEAGADHFLNLMFTFDREDRMTGILVNVPCPSQTSENLSQMSADFWNEVRELVAQEYGPDVYILPHCAPAGDLSPRILHYKQAQQRRMELKYGLKYDPAIFNCYEKSIGERRDIAQRILEGIRDVYGWAKKEIFHQIPLRRVHVTAQLQRRMITEEEKQWCENNVEYLRQMIPDVGAGTAEEIRVAVSRYEDVKKRNQGVLERYRTQKDNPTKPHKINVIQLGDIAFAFSPFELYMDFMHRIQARSPFIQTFVVQLAGDGLSGYLATERAVRNKGYSASLLCNRVSPEGGQQLVELTLDILNDLKDKDEAERGGQC